MAILQGNAKQGSVRGFYPKTIEGSLRFNDDDGAYLTWTPASAGNRKTWTWSGWVKRGNIGSLQSILSASDGTQNNEFLFFFNSTNTLNIQQTVSGSTSGQYSVVTNAVFRDPSAWYHVVLSFDVANTTINIYVNGVLQTLSESVVNNTNAWVNNTNQHAIGKRADASLYLDGYLAEVHFTDGTAYDADAFGEFKNGVWVAKTPDVTYGTNGFYLNFQDDTEVEAFNTVLYNGTNGVGGSVTGVGFKPDLIWVKSRSAVRSHVISDSVRGTNANLFPDLTNAESTASTGMQSFDSDGFTYGTTAPLSDGSLVAWCWDAGANNAVTGHSSVTYTAATSNGNYRISGLPFRPDLLWFKCRDNAENHYLMDSVRGIDTSKTLISNGTNTESTNGIDSGTQISVTDDGFIINETSITNGELYFSGRDYVAWAWDAGDGDPVSNTDGSITSTVKASTTNGFSIVSWVGDSTSAGKTVGHGLSSAPNFIIFKNRDDASDWPVYHTSLGTDYAVYLNTTGAQDYRGVGFLNSTAPSSSLITLHTWNLNNGTGDDMIAYCFHDVTGKQKFSSYTGTGSTGLTVTTGFRPGFLMIKRDGFSHWEIHDGSRDPFANPSTKILNANQSNAEDDNANGSFEFTDTGFIVQTTHEERNNSGDTYIYAAFAGSYSDYITDYNTDGSIDSRVKANDTTGFSIVSYTGTGANATVGHGLSSAPDWIFVKPLDTANSWATYDSANGGTNYMALQSTQASSANSTRWNNTDPTSTVFSVGSHVAVNDNGNRHIAYCWAEKTGYSKFGSYAGNATSVDLGFNPAFILIKRTTGTGKAWWLFDNTREVDGQFGDYLIPNENYPEQTVATAISVSGNTITFPNNWDSTHDGSASSTYIYAAFADTREAAFWLDQSGNDNDWQPVNLDHNDTVADSPTNNFATLNPLAPYSAGTYSEGNLKVTTASSQYGPVLSTIAVSSGKYYCELTERTTGSIYTAFGGYSTSKAISTTTGVDSAGVGSFCIKANTGNFVVDGSETSYGSSWTTGDVIGMALNLDDNEVTFYKNGVSQGTRSITAGEYYIAASDNWGAGSSTFEINFGQQPFKYDPPA